MKKGKKQANGFNKVSQAELYFRRTDGNFTECAIDGMQADHASKPLALHHRPRVPRKSGSKEQQQRASSGLNTAFDPMKDRHMWAMWRTAVNGRIVDEVRRLEQARTELSIDPYSNGSNGSATEIPDAPPSYGKALSGAPPLSRFIRLDNHSKNVAQSLMREGQGQLKTSQFIYYGLPRVFINDERDPLDEPSLPYQNQPGDALENDHAQLNHFN